MARIWKPKSGRSLVGPGFLSSSTPTPWNGRPGTIWTTSLPCQGIGIMTANRLVRHNIRTVLTGSCGPKAFQELQSAGIEVFLNAQGSVRQAVASLQEGKTAPRPPDLVFPSVFDGQEVTAGSGSKHHGAGLGAWTGSPEELFPLPDCQNPIHLLVSKGGNRLSLAGWGRRGVAGEGDAPAFILSGVPACGR